MSAAWLNTETPRVFTLPPSTAVLNALVRTLRARFDADRHPEALTSLLLLTPTRRAAKALGDAFAAEAGEGVALLPMIRPLGDIDVDDPPFEPGELAGIAPPALGSARRQFELARLILAKEAALGRSIGLGGALALARPLAELLDDMADEGVDDLSPLADSLVDYLPEDRREAVEFLSILQTAWPARLAELGVMDSAARRSLVLNALAERWTKTPPDHPVIIVGSTGSIPAVRRLMGVVAHLDQGAVVLPGFDWDMDARAFAEIDAAHPQWAMRAFVNSVDLAPNAVATWPGAAETEDAGARRRVIAEALRPASTTDEWLSRLTVLKDRFGPDYFERGLEGLSLIEAADPLQEARCCALLLRQALHEPGKTAMLVTPDRSLARRVSAEMLRFGVRVDDSGGAALSECAAGAFLIRLVEAALDPSSIIAQSSLWASPHFSAGLARGAVHTALAKAEAEAWRGVRPQGGFDGLRARLDGERVRLHPADKELALEALGAEETALSALIAQKMARPAQWARRHVLAAEALASTDSETGAVRLWSGEDGEAAAALLRDLLEESEALPEMRLADYLAVLRDMAVSRRVPPKLGVHPRLQILGPLEARLMQADRVILAGLNEGVWPTGLGQDPWMSRGMREAVKLAVPEQRHGLAAHDFAQLAASGEVYLTRAEKADGAPTVASRWIWRLKTLVEGAQGDVSSLTGQAAAYLSLVESLDRPAHPSRPAPAPEPRPPVALRPRALSITEIRTWIRDPYSIFAKHVLGLKRLDPADMMPSHRERGTALHEVLEEALKAWRGEWPEDAAAQLVERARGALLSAGFAPADLGLELPRFARAAQWLDRWERRRRDLGISVAALETWLETRLTGPQGDWRLYGKADRFDRHPDGRLDVLDYKTGSAASAKEVEAGFDPQLPLTAALAAEEGSSKDLAASPPAALAYLTLSGNAKGGEERRIDGRGSRKLSSEELAEAAMADLLDLIALFDQEETAYPSQSRAKYKNDYSDFDHLARRGEWALAADESEGEAR
ncbi:MAG: double-strand break repair protein AddB [Alphaproteobacteria bacterium]|nr:double-strand break repair protein AddB [Alphaproteobacteria bacterium]